MTDTARNLLAVLVWLLAATVVAVALTAYAAYDMRAECHADGGTFTASSALLTCSY